MAEVPRSFDETFATDHIEQLGEGDSLGGPSAQVGSWRPLAIHFYLSLVPATAVAYRRERVCVCVSP